MFSKMFRWGVCVCACLDEGGGGGGGWRNKMRHGLPVAHSGHFWANDDEDELLGLLATLERSNMRGPKPHKPLERCVCFHQLPSERFLLATGSSCVP